MGRSEIRAILCAGKIGIDSSIQAQRAGEVMSQNWRIYCLFDRLVRRPDLDTEHVVFALGWAPIGDPGISL